MTTLQLHYIEQITVIQVSVSKPYSIKIITLNEELMLEMKARHFDLVASLSDGTFLGLVVQFIQSKCDENNECLIDTRFNVDYITIRVCKH